VKVTSSMAAAAEAIRILRNISVLLLREESRGQVHIAPTAHHAKRRSRKPRTIDLDQAKDADIMVSHRLLSRTDRARPLVPSTLPTQSVAACLSILAR
jgi:hypothetical protein